MPSETHLGRALWRQIEETTDKDAPVVKVLHQLIKHYTNSTPEYIPAYELERTIDQLGYSKQEIWKQLVDFLCFDTKILELSFRLIEDDEHHEISLETLQSIMAGDPIELGSNTYTSIAAQNQIFPYFIPTENFRWLLDAEDASNA